MAGSETTMTMQSLALALLFVGCLVARASSRAARPWLRNNNNNSSSNSNSSNRVGGVSGTQSKRLYVQRSSSSIGDAPTYHAHRWMHRVLRTSISIGAWRGSAYLCVYVSTVVQDRRDLCRGSQRVLELAQERHQGGDRHRQAGCHRAAQPRRVRDGRRRCAQRHTITDLVHR